MSFLLRESEGSVESNNEFGFNSNAPMLNNQDDYDSTQETTEPDTEPLPASSSSLIKFYPEWCTCFGGSAIQYPIGEDVTCVRQIRYLCQCPPFGPVAKITIFISLFALMWLILWLLVGDIAGVSGPICAIIILEMCGLFAGMGLKTLGMPALLAPLIIGIIFRNIDSIDIFEFFKFPYTDEYCASLNSTIHPVPNDTTELNRCCQKFANQQSSKWIGPIREIALALILTRAGTELSPKQLKKLKGVVPALAFIPCVTEGISCSVLFKFCFWRLNPPIFLCLVAGFAISAVSPAVVVPGMLSLARKGYGVAQGVPTLLVAASSIDDVLAISLYTIFLSLGLRSGVEDETCHSPFVTEHTDLQLQEEVELAGGPLGIVIGIIYGIIVGMILHFLPSRDTRSKGNIRLILLLSCNIACMLGFGELQFISGAGSLGVLTTSFVASFGWRSQPHWKPSMHQVETKLTHLWTLFVPILFGTIGKEMRFLDDKNDLYLTQKDKLQLNTKFNELLPFDGLNIARIIGIIAACLLIRCSATYIIGMFAKLKHRERLFVALAWIPKATVQAALAPLVISTILEKGVRDPEVKVIGKHIVVMAVFAILLTAPVGALLISLLGPRLLQRVMPEEVEEEFPNGEPPEDEDNDSEEYRKFRDASRTSQTDRRSTALVSPSTHAVIMSQAPSLSDIELDSVESMNDTKV